MTNEQRNAYNRKRYAGSAEVRERAKQASYAWRERNLEHHQATAKAWYEANRDRSLAAGKAYRERNPDKMRTKFLMRTYGITEADYLRMLAEQGGVCAICGTAPEGRLDVDHDHATGRVRGLLCNPCNTGIAYLERLMAYLDRARTYLGVAS